MSSPTISIITPCYNSADTLKILLEELPKQTVWERVIEYIIVGYTDDGVTEELLRKNKDPKLKLVFLEENHNPAVKRNLGAKMAKGDIICFIDADAYPAKDWIETIINAYESGIKVGGGSYSIPEFQSKKSIAICQYFIEFSQFMPFGKVRRTPLVPTCNLFCDRKLFLNVGGIPEIRASEDSLFGLKVNEYEPMYFIPKARVFHIFREDRQKYLSNQFMLGKYVFVYRKYHYNNIYFKPFLFYIMLIPFALFKMLRIFVRVCKLGKGYPKLFFKSFGLFIRGIIVWFKGFIQGFKEYDQLILELSEEKK
jgi:glycosyltransferase involved in cell wall biosynthesis